MAPLTDQYAKSETATSKRETQYYLRLTELVEKHDESMIIRYAVINARNHPGILFHSTPVSQPLTRIVREIKAMFIPPRVFPNSREASPHIFVGQPVISYVLNQTFNASLSRPRPSWRRSELHSESGSRNRGIQQGEKLEVILQHPVGLGVAKAVLSLLSADLVFIWDFKIF